MKISKKTGKCLECDAETNILLDKGVYACKDCLNRIAVENAMIQRFFRIKKEDLGEEEYDKMFKFLAETLSTMQLNGIHTIGGAINLLEGMRFVDDYINGLLDKKTMKKVEKQLDILNSLW